MEIKHQNGGSVKTEELNDLDSELMEASSNLHKLFAKYNRQLLVLGEMKATKESNPDQGCSFFHIGKEGDSQEILNNNANHYFSRLNRFIQNFTAGRLFISIHSTPPIQDELPPTSSQL